MNHQVGWFRQRCRLGLVRMCKVRVRRTEQGEGETYKLLGQGKKRGKRRSGRLEAGFGTLFFKLALGQRINHRTRRAKSECGKEDRPSRPIAARNKSQHLTPRELAGEESTPRPKMIT